jgi:hypothetical protein
VTEKVKNYKTLTILIGKLTTKSEKIDTNGLLKKEDKGDI